MSYTAEDLQFKFIAPDAEDVACWRSGASSPDAWTEKTKKLLQNAGAEGITYGFGHDGETDRGVFMFQFYLRGERYKILWPVLQSRGGLTAAAMRQAATLLYHDVKAKCVAATVIGPRTAFFANLQLPDGRTVSQAASSELPMLALELK